MNKLLLPGSKPDLLQQARKFGVKGRADMTVDQLRDAVGEATKAQAPAPRGGAASKALRDMAQPPAEAAAPESGVYLGSGGADAAPTEPAPQDFDAQLAELQQLLQSSGSSPEPVQNAAASQQVAQMPTQWQSPPMPQNRLLGPR